MCITRLPCYGRRVRRNAVSCNKNIIMLLKIIPFIFLSLLNIYSQHNLNEEAIELNNQAVKLHQEGAIQSIPDNFTNDAILLLDKAIEIDSAYSLAYYNKCNFLWELNKNQEALTTAKRFAKLHKDEGYYYLGLAYEYVDLLDSAKDCYKYILETSKSFSTDTLDYKIRQGLATLITIVEGKEKGFNEIQKIIEENIDELSEFEFRALIVYKNEIESYQGGGILEFMNDDGREYCIVTNKSLEQIIKYLEDNGVNAGIVSREGGYFLNIKDKFKEKAFSLGITQCK